MLRSTRKILLSLGHNCSRIYGDPAVLMPAIYQPKIDLILSDYVIIPHFSEEEKLRQRFPKEKIISMKGTDYMSVIDRICSTKKVISSSLHGIILAETYGIPAVFYQDRPEKFNFKYADWYESTNRSFSIETNLESAILKKAPLPPNLDKMRYDLESSFPYDLWECL
jgi:pyruvyltransferase